ncbi:hypothetical protein BDY21DRAFT_94968 [Lineolata rhizophorae]|uniref:Uncharacterized protein n=1 Tax=Lineolata rhizophorae TaxID=578093 RepID=A0A6A6NTP6_9PEZI|nr:hypothetical protein BDY21DRAFT_94968 [Lineolata rhizophorae]
MPSPCSIATSRPWFSRSPRPPTAAALRFFDPSLASLLKASPTAGDPRCRLSLVAHRTLPPFSPSARLTHLVRPSTHTLWYSPFRLLTDSFGSRLAADSKPIEPACELLHEVRRLFSLCFGPGAGTFGRPSSRPELSYVAGPPMRAPPPLASLATACPHPGARISFSHKLSSSALRIESKAKFFSPSYAIAAGLTALSGPCALVET